MLQIAVLGDLHGQFDEADVAALNADLPDLVLFVGDLCRYVSPRQTRRMARHIGALRMPALVVAGNHDVANLPQIMAEMRGHPRLARWLGRRHRWHHEQLRQALAPAVLGGYSRHEIETNGQAVAVVVGRPYALGGSQFSFAPVLEAVYGVRDLESSAARLCQIVDETACDRLIFLAHNGPHGLGEQPEDPWGCDFDPARGDYGDRDLSVAILHARRQGRQVLAVIAGHMHRRSRSGHERAWHHQQDGTHYVNAAEVPRVRDGQHGQRRHQVRLEIGAGGVLVQDRWI